MCAIPHTETTETTSMTRPQAGNSGFEDSLYTGRSRQVRQFGALTLRPPTNRPCHIPTHTVRLQNFLSTMTISYCDTSTMWHFLWWHSNSVTIFHCDIPTQSWWIICPPKIMDSLSQCDILTHCNFGQPMAVTFCPLRTSIFSVGFFAF
jgi:hypothetical protein